MEASKYRSTEINAIMCSLAKAQGSYKKLIPNENSARGPYANLDSIRDATRDALSANLLAFYQYLEMLDEGAGASLLWSVLGHESGQWISSCARIMISKTDRQTDNTLEINKRIQAMMVLGIAPSRNDPDAHDDDGHAQIEEQTLENLKKPAKDIADLDYNEPISKHQYTELLLELDGFPDIVEGIKKTYDITTLADLPKTEYHPALAQLRRIRKTHEDYRDKQGSR